MAQLINVKLSRFDACPWGFRLQGGKDFGSPLVIQKVNGGSPAEKAGLQAGDAVIKVNDVEVFNLRHKEAQDQIVRAGNNFELTIQRGGSTWKPQVTPVGPTPVIGSHNIQPVTKTSLAAKPQASPHIGSTHNFAPKPFGGPQVNGDATVKSIVNKQYNSPVGIYSEETIAETLSAQAEVLAGGVLGVNFKKNEKTYNPATSEVLKMVQEIDSEPKIPEPEPSSIGTITSPPTGLRHVSAPETKPTPTTPNDDPFKVLPPGQNICAECERLIVQSHAVGGRATSPRPLTPIARQLQSPSIPRSQTPTNVPADTPKCSDCERYIIGVFVRIKDKNLHVECFKCATCGASLKNVGYYNINNKLYCDIHAKLAARQNPPAPNWDPVTIPPGGKAPTGALPASLAKAASTAATKTTPPTYAPAPAPAPAPARPAPAPAPSSPQSNLAPLPFHPVSHTVYKNGFESEKNLKNGISSISTLHNDDTDSIKSNTSILIDVNKAPRGGHHHVNPPRPIQQSPSSLAGPKPFSTPAAPTTSPARPAPAGSKFVWPPRAEEEEPTPTATPLYIPPSSHSPRPTTPKAAAVAVKPSPKPMPPAPVPSISPRVTPVASQPPMLPPQPPPKVAPITNQPPVLPVQPFEPITTSLLMPVTKPSTKVAPFPQPFSEYIAKHRSALISVASPTPLQQPPPSEEPKPIQSHQISEKITQEQDTAINKRLSVCSEEVLSINAEKSVPKFETLTECLTPDGVQRPASPVPMHEVSQASSSQDIASEVGSSKQEVSEVKAEVDTKVSSSETEKQLSATQECVSEEASKVHLKDIQQSEETISDIPQSEKSVKESVTQEFSLSEQKQEQLVTSQQSIQFSEAQTSSQISIEKQEVVSEFVSTQSSAQSASCFVPVSKEQQQSASQFQQHTRQLSFEKNSMLTSTALPTSSHLNRDQECPSPMVSALTIAPDRPYSPLPSATKPTSSSSVVTSKISQAHEIQTSVASRSEQCSSPMVSALTIASDRPYSPLPSATRIPAPSGTEAPPSFTQPPTQAPKMQPVLPTQINPSFKQSPTQTVLPTQRAPASPVYIPTASKALPPAGPLGGSVPTEGCSSPMLSALTIAPDRPYSPLPTITKIPASAPTHTTPVLKPATAVAPPPSTLPISSVSREEACPSPMVAALTIAPERPYSPLTPITQAPWFEAARTHQKQLQTSFAPVQPMVPKKTGTQLPVAKTLPLTTAPKYSLPPSVTHTPSVIPQPKPVPSKSAPPPKASGSTVQQLPVIGGFRPIVAPNTADTFRPISQEISQTQAVPPERSLPPRPQTPKARTATPTSGGRSGTPKISTLTGLHKPATIPFYQLEIGEYPGQRPSSATPTCPMTDPQAPRARTPQPLQQTATPASFPYPNIPLPEGVRPGAAPPSQTFKPIPQPSVSKQTSTAPVYKPSPTPVSATQVPTSIDKTPSVPNAGGGGSIGGGSTGDKRGVAGSTAPRRGRGVLTQPQGGGRIPVCASCSSQIRGPFITALGKTWCPEHFICVNAQCRRPLADIGFVEEKGEVYCEYCFEKYLAPTCDKCGKKVKGDCLNAIGKHFHPECFLCAYCGKLFGNNPFFLEDGLPYCEADWNELFTTKCFACGFPIEAGDRWVEALSNNYHSQCFNCTACKKNLEGQSFYAKGGRPFCKAHAR